MGDTATSPTAPQYDSSLTRQTGADQIANTISGAQQLVPVLGGLERSQAGLNNRFNLRSIVAPGETFYAKQFGPANKTLTALKKAATRVKNGQTQYRVGNNWISSDAYQTQLSNAQTKVTEIQNRPITELTSAFADQFAARDRLLGSMDSAQASSPEYLRMQDAYGQGTTARTAGTAQASAAGMGQVADVQAGTAVSRDANLTMGQAAQMGQVADVNAREVAASRMGNFGQATSRDITAGQVGLGALGQTLMGRALTMAQSDGRLNAQADRDATQSARQGMAARGMATGNAALGAELLNRDRYARQRQFQDLGFAQGVQGQDLGRQFQNVGNQLAADQSNQGAAMQAELANLQARLNAAVQQGNWKQAAAVQNQWANLQAQMSNQQTAFNTGQFNAGNLQQTNMANMQAANQVSQFNAGQANDMTQFGLGQQLTAGLANQQTALNTGQFNAGNQQQANLANMQATNNMSQFNAGQLTDADRYNMGLIGTSAQMADAEQARKLGLQQNVYNFGLQSDPRMILSGMGSPLSNMTGLGAQLANVNLSPMYSGAQFSSGGGANRMMDTLGGALSGAATGAPGGPKVAAVNAVLGGLSGFLSSKK